MFMPGTVNSMAEVSSPAVSVSSFFQPQQSDFSGKSPALTYQSLPARYTSALIRTLNTSHKQTAVDTRLRYKQHEEQSLREHIAGAQNSIEPRILNRLYNLGWLLFEQGRYKKAEDAARGLLRDIREYKERYNDNLLHTTFEAMDLLGYILGGQGRYAEAERLFRHVWMERTKLLEPDDLNMLGSLGQMGLALSHLGRDTEAEARYRQALEGMIKVLGLEHEETFRVINNFGTALDA
jgi:tetratricopeptide (TPR) repeat protein